MRKILFLDIDGVVNNRETMRKYTHRGCTGIDPELAFIVGKIKLYTDCEVVLSSSWRHIPENHEVIKQQVCDFIDITPSCCAGIRGVEIYQWISKNIKWDDRKTLNYAILDDDSDMLLWQKDHFFQTDGMIGITEEIAQRVIEHLNREPETSTE